MRKQDDPSADLESEARFAKLLIDHTGDLAVGSGDPQTRAQRRRNAQDPTRALIDPVGLQAEQKLTAAPKGKTPQHPNEPPANGTPARPSNAAPAAQGSAPESPKSQPASPGQQAPTGHTRHAVTARPGNPTTAEQTASDPAPRPSQAPTVGVNGAPKPAAQQGPAPTGTAASSVQAVGKPQPVTAPAIASKGAPGRISPSKPELQTPRAPIFKQEAALPSQVARGLAAVIRKGEGNVSIRLTPDTLGTVRVDLSMKDGAVSARVEASSEAATRALADGIEGLRTELDRRGLRVERLEVVGAERAENSRGRAEPAPTPAETRSNDGEQTRDAPQQDASRDPDPERPRGTPHANSQRSEAQQHADGQPLEAASEITPAEPEIERDGKGAVIRVNALA